MYEEIGEGAEELDLGGSKADILALQGFLFQVYEEIGEGAEELDLGGSKVNMRAYCSWFNFKGSDQQKKLSVLSGGERNRLQLAKASAGPLLGPCMLQTHAVRC